MITMTKLLKAEKLSHTFDEAHDLVSKGGCH